MLNFTWYWCLVDLLYSESSFPVMYWSLLKDPDMNWIIYIESCGSFLTTLPTWAMCHKNRSTSFIRIVSYQRWMSKKSYSAFANFAELFFTNIFVTVCHIHMGFSPLNCSGSSVAPVYDSVPSVYPSVHWQCTYSIHWLHWALVWE